MDELQLPESSTFMDAEKVSNSFEKVIKLLNSEGLTTSELVVLLGNLMYTIGASSGGYGSTGPSIDKLEELYQQNPTNISVGLMYQAWLLLAWYEEYKNHLLGSKSDTTIEEKGE